eukprot:CAMPEP_0114436662 /NCGR_PEP_ID=MMETSP0103-20121206/13581_1 /TAXON_ID=37642 ORGANISM="Paraphysomonas imperforata, Strain PA2" /NCGR_SAMPLE_ID=MMETSP0103 /ASSEMBLY_ACC=CAM_ASM_000201 /LENGTH=85 /DNA_ID=CAMNT_0001606965 /DNA_START=65 /DNA_END=322 /DNA_ORIENTATION=+
MTIREEDRKETTSPKLILRLREKKITWDEEVVNNEHMGKKSSNRCCIFHKARRYDESDSSESDSDIEIAEKEESEDRKPYLRHHA